MAASTDDLVERRARAMVQHQRVMAEAAQVARLGLQARHRTMAAPVFASAVSAAATSVRQRVQWVRAS